MASVVQDSTVSSSSDPKNVVYIIEVDEDDEWQTTLEDVPMEPDSTTSEVVVIPESW